MRTAFLLKNRAWSRIIVMIELVYGGSGSGKSEFAEKLILESECESRFYIATMKIFDGEGKKRVERHRKLREKKNFITIEETNESKNLEDAVEKIRKMSSGKNLGDSIRFGAGKSSEKKKSAVLVECLSNLLANEMFLSSGKILSAGEAAKKVISGLNRLFSSENFISEIVLVSNNIFDDGLDYDEATKSYMEALAEINAFAAKNADKVFEVVAGIALEIPKSCWK